jgi:putative NIF3 family GTP cyclohydrolase 1 type 2
MEAKKLYARLEKDFIKPGLSDDWAQYMTEVQDFLSDNFKARSIGLVCDNTSEIKKVFSAVFPTSAVMKEVLKSGEDSMLFVHHPSIWDITKAPNVFQQMDRKLLKRFRERRISIYNLHVPLDNFGRYSTSSTLATALGIAVEKSCSPYYGSLAGVIGRAPCRTNEQLKKIFERAVGHRVKLCQYGSDEIAGGRVAVLAGGGNSLEYLADVFAEGIKTIVTGITVRNPHSEKTHAYEEANGINVLGGTHYSTEKFACIAMCDYFKKLGLPCKFIEGKPGMKDL